IRQCGGAFGDHRLADVDFRHGASEATEAFLNLEENGLVEVELAAQQIREGLASDVVVSGSEAAGSDNDFGAVERVTKRGTHILARIADDCFMHDADAELVEFRSKEKRIRVEAVWGQEF